MRRRRARGMRYARWLYAPLVATLAVPASSKVAFACSGPRAGETFLRNERLGWTLWAVTLAIAVTLAAMPRVRAQRMHWLLLLLALLHPGWWMSARRGDCGYMLRDGAILVTAFAAVAGVVIYWRSGRRSS